MNIFCRISEVFRQGVLFWLLVLVVVLALLVATSALKYLVSLVAAVLLLNGIYHTALTIWEISKRVLAIASRAARSIFFQQ